MKLVDWLIREASRGTLTLNEVQRLLEDLETIEYPSTKTVIGKILDQIMQQVNVKNLLDSFIGGTFDPQKDVVRLYFSKSAEKEVMQQLAGAAIYEGGRVVLEKTDTPGAEWVVTVVPERDLEKVPMSGVIKQPVFVSGVVPVGR